MNEAAVYTFIGFMIGYFIFPRLIYFMGAMYHRWFRWRRIERELDSIESSLPKTDQTTTPMPPTKPPMNL